MLEYTGIFFFLFSGSKVVMLCGVLLVLQKHPLPVFSPPLLDTILTVMRSCCYCGQVSGGADFYKEMVIVPHSSFCNGFGLIICCIVVLSCNYFLFSSLLFPFLY